jgi:hypothetical protein
MLIIFLKYVRSKLRIFGWDKYQLNSTVFGRLDTSMTSLTIIAHRLSNQKITSTTYHQAEDIVSWLVAMQAQEYAMAKWAIGLRSPGLKEAEIESAFNEGLILRTHLMRPTWHFVSPADIRWLVALTAPRVRQTMTFMNKQLELDSAIFNRSNRVLEKVLQGGKFLTRKEIQVALSNVKIKAEGTRLAHLMANAELDALVCSGPRQGKQFTYALLEERAKPVKALTRDESLALFASRYFSSRWPATIHDFAYWSGLTIKDARKGAEMLGSEFARMSINGNEYIVKGNIDVPHTKKGSTFLMPDYDEYGMSYKDRTAMSRPKIAMNADPISNHILVINGRIGGTWQRSRTGDSFFFMTEAYIPSNKINQRDLSHALKRYQDFLGQGS